MRSSLPSQPVNQLSSSFFFFFFFFFFFLSPPWIGRLSRG
jgi:hypothetical protein